MIQLSKNELDILEAQIQSEQNLATTFRKYSDDATDPELKILYQKISAINQNCYNKLLNLLKGE